MVTVKDETTKPVTPVINTLNDVPVGQLFRGRVHYAQAGYGGYHDGIFRKYRGPWNDNGVAREVLVVAQTGKTVLTWGQTTPTTMPGLTSFFTKCFKVENYEPLVGVLTVTKA